MRIRRIVLACFGCLVLAASCNMPHPPIPTKLGQAQIEIRLAPEKPN